MLRAQTTNVVDVIAFTTLDTEHVLDVEFDYAPNVVGGNAGEYASELTNSVSLHVWLTHGIQGERHRHRVLVVPSEYITHAFVTREIDGGRVRVHLRLPIDTNAMASFAREVALAERRWALPGSRALVPTKGKYMPANVQLRIAQYVESANEAGLMCRVDAGSTAFLLKELLTAAATSKRRVLERSIVMRTGDGDDDLVKGNVKVVRARVVRADDDDAAVTSISVRFERLGDFMWVPRESDPDRFAQLQAESDALIDRSIELYYGKTTRESLVYEYEGANGARCPLYTLDAMRLPAAAYLLHVPLGDNDTGVYRESLRAAMRADDVRAEHLLVVIEQQLALKHDRMLAAMPRVLATMANMLTTVTHAMTVYENDFVVIDAPAKAQISENFKEAEDEDGDDCEDSGKLNFKMAVQFEYVRFGERTAVDALLRAYQRMLFEWHWYQVGLIMPAIVTNKNLDARAIDADSIAAHTFAVAVPTTLMLETIADYALAPIQLAEQARSSRDFIEYTRNARQWHASLPFLVMEGTAPSDSLPLPVGAYYTSEVDTSSSYVNAARAIVQRRGQAQTALIEAELPSAVQLDASQRVFDYSERMRVGDEDISTFYKIVSTLVVRSSTGIMSYGVFTLRDDGTLTAGASWSNLTSMQRPSRVRFVPEYAIDERMGAIIDDALLQAEPVPALVRDEAHVHAHTLLHGGVPDILLHGLAALFPTIDVTKPPPDSSACASSVLLDHVDVMPLPAAVVTLRMRCVDISHDTGAQHQIVRAFEATRSLWSRVYVEHHYLCDAPVIGESELPAVEAIHIYAYLT